LPERSLRSDTSSAQGKTPSSGIPCNRPLSFINNPRAFLSQRTAKGC
jgi:hypothetical protein